jgi:hypothetical protein
MKRVLLIPLLFIVAAAALYTSAASRAYNVIVSAGKLDRRDAVVSFALPEGASAALYQLVDESGRITPLQIDSERRAWFVLKELSSGATKTYRLQQAKRPDAEQVQVIREGDDVFVKVAAGEALRYRGGKGELPRSDIKPIYRRGGYIHPVFTPSGRMITDDYPPNHLHHHGIWFPWTKTEFEGRQPDFWNMGEGKGTVEFVSYGRTWSGPVQGGFQTSHNFVDLSAPTPKAALTETWEVKVYSVGQTGKPYRMFDLVSVQQCAGSSPLILPEYHYGGLGFRGRRQWDGKENTFFLTSEGKDRSNGHGTRARWCHIGGRVDGELAGIAILCHPDNFRAPQPMRIHPDEPFFCFAPSQLGRWEISPGTRYVSRYRFIVYDGPPDTAEIERLWNGYASPPDVKVVAR